MRKTRTGFVLLLLVSLIVLLVACVAAYFVFALPHASAPARVTVSITPERVARGRYLATHVAVCLDCHSQRDWTKYTAPVIEGTEGSGGEPYTRAQGIPGTFQPSNLTPAHLREWTDGELMRAITEGVNKAGDALFPIMPYESYRRMSTEDLEAIVAYIRSLPERPATAHPRELDFPVNLFVRMVPAPAAPASRPSPSDRLAFGEYVATIAGCSHCHTPMDGMSKGPAFSGGFELTLPTGQKVRAANITPDVDTGIGRWTETQFVDRFKVFDERAADRLPLAPGQPNTIMPWSNYAGMTRDDLGAIYAFLRTVRPVANRVAPFAALDGASRSPAVP